MIHKITSLQKPNELLGAPNFNQKPASAYIALTSIAHQTGSINIYPSPTF